LKNYYENKKILIFGGTGTIGEGLAKRLLDFDPQVVRIFSRDEYKQFKMESAFNNPDKFRFLIGDIRDYDRVKRAAEDVDIIFHAAAMKHVPACEYNPFEAVKTNVLGTENIIRAAMSARVKNVVFTSSDKAISPTNAMGATKLLAERLVSAAHYSRGTAPTIFASVRFGNVMGSRGSVINLFKSQILEKRKITLTEGAMTRFMMTKRQAVDLTLQAAVNSKGGEVFVLKMPVIRLEDLATVVVDKVCDQFGIDPQTVTIENIGLRPGEKMYEELMTEEEYRTALDLGAMFAVPTQFAGSTGYVYEGVRTEKEHVINSDRLEPISKDEIRRMVEAENLI